MVRPRNWCPKKCRKLRFLGPQSWAVWGVQNRNFWTFPDMSGKTPKVPIFWDFRKSAEIHKNRQNRRNRHFCQNPEKWHFLALWVQPYVSGQKPENLPESRFWRVWPESPKIGPDTKKCQFLRSQKSAKKCENFRNFWPPKNPKKSAVPAGNDASQMAENFARRDQKNGTFSRIFRGKGKKCPFFRLNGRFCD